MAAKRIIPFGSATGNGSQPPPGPTATQPHTQPIPADAGIYRSVQGDWWDLISIKVYGMKRFDEFYMHKLLEANYELRNVCEFPAGLLVVVPRLPIKTAIPLVPWTSANVVVP